MRRNLVASFLGDPFQRNFIIQFCLESIRFDAMLLYGEAFKICGELVDAVIRRNITKNYIER